MLAAQVTNPDQVVEAVLQLRARAGIRGQGDGPDVGGAGALNVTGLGQQVAPSRPSRLKVVGPLDLFERAQAGLGTIHVADGHTEGNACSKGGRKLHQRLMQYFQGDAVGAVGSRPFAVHRLNGRFQLEPSDGLKPVGATEQRLALAQQRGIPPGGILVIEGGRFSGRGEAGWRP